MSTAIMYGDKDVTEVVRVMFDALVGSLDWGSGFLDVEECVAIEAARIMLDAPDDPNIGHDPGDYKLDPHDPHGVAYTEKIKAQIHARAKALLGDEADEIISRPTLDAVVWRPGAPDELVATVDQEGHNHYVFYSSSCPGTKDAATQAVVVEKVMTACAFFDEELRRARARVGVSPSSPLDVQCPVCNEPVGSYCKGDDGVPMLPGAGTVAAHKPRAEAAAAEERRKHRIILTGPSVPG